VAAEKRRQGKPEPRAIRERPSIQQEHEELWIAFAELDGARQIGFEACPIPCTEVESWCRTHRVGVWRREMFWRVIHRLDVEARALAEKRRPRDHAPTRD
jgi:hypothetical protein